MESQKKVHYNLRLCRIISELRMGYPVMVNAKFMDELKSVFKSLKVIGNGDYFIVSL